MATLDKTESTLKGARQVIQDLIAPELRELKVEVRGIHERLDRMDERLDRIDGRLDRMDGRFDRTDGRLDRIEQLIANGFEMIRKQLDTFHEVQLLKERMARMEGERGASPAA